MTNFGDQSVTGQAVVRVDEHDDIEFVDGDAFVVPQIYRNHAQAELLRMMDSSRD